MAITSTGYPSTIAPGSAFALMAYAFGRQYVAPFVSHCQVTISNSGTRRVSISTGYLAGKHIVDYNDAVVNIDLPNASGTSQWFCIVLNRWVDAGGGTFRSEFGYVAGTSARAIPALTQNPGTFDQQPIALVRISSTATLPQEVVDLRAIAEEPGTYTVYDDLALDVIDRPGVTVYNAKTNITYRRVYNASQAREWQRVWDAPNGPRPYLALRRNSAFSGPITSGSVPLYAGVEADHVKYGGWADAFSYSNGASGVASNPSNTSPAYIQTKVPGTYAYGVYVDMTSVGNAANVALSAQITADIYVGGRGPDDPYWHQYALQNERLHWTLTNTLWLPAGARFGPSFGKSSGGIQINKWNMWMTRLGD
jgi:hypothetical protein